ncbi:MAG: iron-containing alcohol dehydrogenase, partial [Firmicutes bacterium]|nr:iron-containing alcohol dehydrogenase [Bacillota bacterium]
VPTTAGTGSETTLAAVISDPEKAEKYPINDPVLIPKYAVLDPQITVKLPPHITSTTGMDALTHAVEAYIGHSNTKETKEMAIKATKLIFDNLETAYKDGSNLEARNNMQHAAYYAGIAFTRAYVGYVHAVAHSLGAQYHIAHGLANAVILPYFLEAYGKTAYKPLAELADVVGITGSSREEKAKKFIEAVKQMNKDMNIPEHFPEIKEEDIAIMSKHANAEGNPLYPVPKLMDRKELAEMYRKIRG